MIGVLANLPLAQASGMGLNAFFVYTVCFGFGLTYANALLLVLLDGIAFGVISYILISVFTGKGKEVKIGTWAIGVLFLIMFFVTH